MKSLPAAQQVQLEVLTSTEHEAWRAVAGSLLRSEKICITRAEPWPKPGTRFRIRFEKRHDMKTIWERICGVLRTYLAYLPATIELYGPEGTEPLLLGRKPWANSMDAIHLASQRYEFAVNGASCDAVLELCNGPDEIYQGGVLISQRYQLLTHGPNPSKKLRGLRIRLESPDFELPFGRHGLRNERILEAIGERLRTDILPRYVGTLRRAYSALEQELSETLEEPTEDLCTQLLSWGGDWQKALLTMPLFVDSRGKRHSLYDLENAVRKEGALYIEGEGSSGIDHDVLAAPVLSQQQPLGGLEFLKEHFSHALVLLNAADLVMEAPKAIAKKLSEDEKRFERYLGLHPGVSSGAALQPINEAAERRAAARVEKMGKSETVALRTVCDEAQQALVELDEVTWRVAYLVQRDGVTAARSQRLLLKGKDLVVLNLHHPEVRDLLELSTTDPLLAGHLGVAMALSDNSVKFLEHLSPAAREDLLLADAMARSAGIESFDRAKQTGSTRRKAISMIRGVRRLCAGARPAPGSFAEWGLGRTRPGQA